MKTFNEYLKENNLSNIPKYEYSMLDLIMDSIPTESLKKIGNFNLTIPEDLKNLFKKNNWPINIPDEHWKNTFDFLKNHNYIK